MSDSLRPPGWLLTRLLGPWDSPGKNTGVGCHALLQGIFQTQGSNPGPLHWQADYLPSEPPGEPDSFMFLQNLQDSVQMRFCLQSSIPGAPPFSCSQGLEPSTAAHPPVRVTAEVSDIRASGCTSRRSPVSGMGIPGSEEPATPRFSLLHLPRLSPHLLPWPTAGMCPGVLPSPSSDLCWPVGPIPAPPAFHAWFSSVQSLSRVRLSATPWTAARQASLSMINSQSLLKLTSIKSVMPSSHLTLCHPLLLLPSIPPITRSFEMSQSFTSGGQSIGVPASISVFQ